MNQVQEYLITFIFLSVTIPLPIQGLLQQFSSDRTSQGLEQLLLLLELILVYLLKQIWLGRLIQLTASLSKFQVQECHYLGLDFSTHFQKHMMEYPSNFLLSIVLVPVHLFPYDSRCPFFKFPFQNLELSSVYHHRLLDNYQAQDSIISSFADTFPILNTLDLIVSKQLHSSLALECHSIQPYFLFYLIPLPKLATSAEYFSFSYIDLDQVKELPLIQISTKYLSCMPDHPMTFLDHIGRGLVPSLESFQAFFLALYALPLMFQYVI